MRPIVGGRTWLLALLILPPLAGFILGGAQLGLAMGAATAAGLVVLASRARPEDRVEVAEAAPGVPGGLFVLALAPIEDPRTAGIVAAMAEPATPATAASGVLVVAPATSRLLDRWADDLDEARFESQRRLTVSLASLAAAGVEAEGRVGDGDPLRAAEDALRSYAATEVVVVAHEGDAGRQIADLDRRLDRPLRRVAPRLD